MSSNKLPEKIVVFGQRGVGKSSFLRRLNTYWDKQQYSFLDLDDVIEHMTQKKIAKIFSEEGESTFRRYELEAFNKILLTYPRFVLSVGGGFNVDKIPSHIYCLWLQRHSDESGRIFLDRPRLDPQKTDLEEFTDRARQRSKIFLQHYDEVYFMSEGLEKENEFEKLLFQSKVNFPEPTYLTLNKNIIYKTQFLNKISDSGFEFRDDLISYDEFDLFLKNLVPRKLILSFRDPHKITTTESALLNLFKINNTLKMVDIDWALELGSPQLLTNIKPTILSAHEYLPHEELTAFLARLESYGNNFHLKASPIINSFSELKFLYEWQQQAPEQRSVLPRSREGHWCWFRQFMKGRQQINFWKISSGSAPDQPTLYQWISTYPHCKHFAAVLGHPVKHSRTPIEQQNFFSKYSAPVFAVDIQEEEFNTACTFLESIGLIAAAVTSPLKLKAFNLVSSNREAFQKLSHLEKELASLNTLFFTREGNNLLVYGSNTDLAGFKAQVSTLPSEHYSHVLIWGGGGTLSIIKKVFPQAIEYSVRTGKARNTDSEIQLSTPDILIWAAAPNAEFPNLAHKPKYVVDLNYKEDSQARAYAKEIGAPYLSGEKMFLAQAEHQRQFWKNFLK